MIQSLQTKGLSVLAAVTAVLAGGVFLFKAPAGPTLGLVLWAGVQSMAAFYALLWAIHRSNRDFFAVFVSDALLRVLTLGIATMILYFLHVPYTVPLLMLAAVYLILSLIQIPFLMQVR